MSMTGLPGSQLREKKHLDPFMKDAFEVATGVRPKSTKLICSSFAGLGPVDVVSSEPRLLMELKWSYEKPGKVFESLWDAIKLVMLGSECGYDKLYVATGAATEEWERTESGDLFATGAVDPLQMWQRPLDPKRGPNYGTTVGEDLVIGGRGNQPTMGPPTISVRLIGRFVVAQDFGAAPHRSRTEQRTSGVAGDRPAVGTDGVIASIQSVSWVSTSPKLGGQM